MIIVDDPPGYLPPDYVRMIEKLLIVSFHKMDTLQNLASQSQSGLLVNAKSDATANNLPNDLVLINGQHQPTMSMRSHAWYRFRMVFVAIEQEMYLDVIDGIGGANCTLKLLAKDGIYLHEIPRPIPIFKLYPGHRSDIAVSCICASYPCTGKLSSSGRAASSDEIGPILAQVMTLTISETPGGKVPVLPVVSLARPCYLVNLLNATVLTENMGTIGLGDEAVTWKTAETSWSGGPMTHSETSKLTNGMLDWPALFTITTGQIYEFSVEWISKHPLHTHVNPYQIKKMPQFSYADGYFAEGDWHDTLVLDEVGGFGVKIRMNADYFSGKMVIHCHSLKHGDEGMMAFAMIAGTEGAHWSGAGDKCFKVAFNPNSSKYTNATMANYVSNVAALRPSWMVAQMLLSLLGFFIM